MSAAKSRILTAATLKDKRACASQVALFRSTFGESVAVTPARARKVAAQFHWDWAAQNLLSPEAYAAYQAATAPAWAAYLTATATAGAALQAAIAPAYAAYWAARATAGAAYQAAKATAWAAYRAAIATADAAYRAARATAFATAYIADKVQSWSWLAQRSIYRGSTDLVLVEKLGDKIAVAQPVNFTMVEQSQQSVIAEPTLILYDTQGQELMQALWDAGLRPNDGARSGAQAQALLKHIAFAERIADGLLLRIKS